MSSSSPRSSVRLGMASMALAGTVALTGCGSTAATGTNANANQPASSSSPMTCPTANTKSFAKTRFVADLGLAAGSFHRYIYKPYTLHKFDKGAHGRTFAIVKAAATAALDVKLLKNATENAQASPLLCNAVAGPLSAASNAFDGLKGNLISGNLGSIAGIETAIQGALTGAKAQGATVTETSN